MPLLLQLHSQQLITLIPHHCPAASAFTTYKSEEKLRFIINLRPYNCLFPTPPSFSLPRFEQILSLPSFKQLWFVKLDIQSCFWSLVLPCNVTGQFFGCLPPYTFSTRRLPFGLAYSPILAHSTVAHYLQPLFQLNPLCSQYLDDLLKRTQTPISSPTLWLSHAKVFTADSRWTWSQSFWPSSNYFHEFFIINMVVGYFQS